MGNVLRVLKRDLIRLFKAPAALIVVVAMMILPSVYTWYNVVGFWNPYENTGGMRVCVVNQDAGGSSSLTGHMDVGSMIVDQLEDNEQLDWYFSSEEAAMHDLDAGDCYAVFVIPPSFTEDLLSLTTGSFTQPVIQYYVNEKAGPVAPKITDTGATTLEETINSSFVEAVSDAVVGAVSEALGTMDQDMDSAASRAALKLGAVSASLGNARTQIGAVEDSISQARQDVSTARTALENARAGISDADAQLRDVSAAAGEAQQTITSVAPEAAEAINTALAALAELSASAGADYQPAIRESIDGLQQCSDILFTQMVPEVSEGLGQLSASTAALSASVASMQVVIDQAQGILNQLDTLLDSSSTALHQTDSLLQGLESDANVLRTDLLAISSSHAVEALFGDSGLDAESIASFMGAPTQLVTEQLYHISCYGAAMAPLFMNLTFWIGAFMLLVIMRQEVDDEGIRRLTVPQRYLSRLLLFSIIAVVQALICCAGVMFLGIEVVNVWAFFLGAALCSLAYLSIIYALSVTMMHIGKGLCIILVFLQIPAATGLYPVEMTAPFFQMISPLFPFTYGISAMREAICGFYGMTFLHDALALLGFLVLGLAFGLILQPLLANVNRMFAKRLGESGIYNGEDVEVPQRKFHISQILRALSDRDEYRQQIQQRYQRFNKMYPRMRIAALVLGFGIPVAVGAIFSLTTGEKVVLLSIWLVWTVAVMVFLVIIEELRYSFERQLELGTMTTEQLQGLYAERSGVHRAAESAPAMPEDSSDAPLVEAVYEPAEASESATKRIVRRKAHKKEEPALSPESEQVKARIEEARARKEGGQQ